MIEMVKGKQRVRCDKCKKLVANEKVAFCTIVDGRHVVDLEDRHYHFCNKSQFDKWWDSRYQLRMGL